MTSRPLVRQRVVRQRFQTQRMNFGGKLAEGERVNVRVRMLPADQDREILLQRQGGPAVRLRLDRFQDGPRRRLLRRIGVDGQAYLLLRRRNAEAAQQMTVLRWAFELQDHAQHRASADGYRLLEIEDGVMRLAVPYRRPGG